MLDINLFGPTAVAEIRALDDCPRQELTYDHDLFAEMALLIPMIRRALTTPDDSILSGRSLLRSRFDHSHQTLLGTEHRFKRLLGVRSKSIRAVREWRQHPGGTLSTIRTWRLGREDTLQMEDGHLCPGLEWEIPPSKIVSLTELVVPIGTGDDEDFIVSFDANGRLVDVHHRYGYEKWRWL